MIARIRVGAAFFDITVVDELKSDDGEPMLGEMNPSNTSIRLLADQSRENMRLMLLHELVHVIGNQCQLRISENQIDDVAMLLLGLVRDNPELVELLRENAN